jgi:predicted ABC-type ATPase
MFAEPNGSGKSTLKSELLDEWLGIYVNADDIERELKSNGNQIDLGSFGLKPPEAEVVEFFATAPLLLKEGLADCASNLRVSDGWLHFGDTAINSYHAAVLADLIRRSLVADGKSLSFETVMSSHDKVAFFCEAKQRGYRTYLYFVATDDPEINIARVASRVEEGGHPVSTTKIVERYHRSLGLPRTAVACADRAYIFDNSGEKLEQLAEITGGEEMEIKTDALPAWFYVAMPEPAESS